jgi:hypothetical protein
MPSNGWDFLRYIQEFQRRANNEECRDLWGLLVIPNAQLVREQGMKSVRLGLDVSKREPLRWRAVGTA